MSQFAEAIIAWQRTHGRHDLPWQRTRDPYAIWLSEIMLQQTQVATVIPYYRRFRERFPDISSLAQADINEVLRLWSGLGYYSRARNLHAAAKQIVERHGGVFPRRLADIEALPGIGRSTAAAIAGFAYGARAAILDGNVKRVLARHFAVEGYPGERAVEQKLWALAESLLPARDIEAYIQGSMDLGATICLSKRPHCNRCPVASTCAAYAQNRVHELPTPRPRKTLPTRETHMAVLLHGDAWIDNLLRRDDGDVVLCDWDGVAVGRREWDLVHTYHGQRRFGLTCADVDDFAAAYGHDLRDWPGYSTLMEVRDMYAIGVHIRNAAGDPFSRWELPRRLESLAKGDGSARWYLAPV